jgi:PAS domain-containing protein
MPSNSIIEHNYTEALGSQRALEHVKVGTVLDSPIALRRIGEAQSNESRDISGGLQHCSTLHALSACAVVLDQTGKVVAANTPSERFAKLAEISGARCHISDNYLEFCKAIQPVSPEPVAAMAAGVREVLAAQRHDFYSEIPFRIIGEECWFQVTVTRIEGAAPGRVVIVHKDITERKLAEVAMRKNRQQLRHSREETVMRLAQAGECREDYTGRHVQRMSRYCALLAERIGLDPDRCELIRLASMLHDLGKIGIEDRILLKRGVLTADEFEVMQKHVNFGHQLLSGSDAELLKLAALIAATHHEKYDGTGYPHGLKGEAIPLEGRIAAIADVFDALSSNRVYRPALPIRTCVNIMRENRGKHFDPNLLDRFLNSLDRVLRIYRQYTDDPVDDQLAVQITAQESLPPSY